MPKQEIRSMNRRHGSPERKLFMVERIVEHVGLS